MTSKKYYAVASGRKPGIYDNWPAAQAQVTGYPGAKFKGFPTREAADAWLKKPTTRQPSVNPPRKTGPSNSDTTPKAGEVTIYTDGSARYNPVGIVAVGMRVAPHPPRRSVREGLPHTAPASGNNAKAH